MCLDSTISSDNNNLNISGYSLIRADHANNSKRGGVYIYYKESPAVQNFEKHKFIKVSSLQGQGLFRQQNRLCRISDIFN